jgi:hypothetical protein
VLAGFLGEDWSDGIAVAGFSITTLGVVLGLVAVTIALVQLRRAVRSADAAMIAAREARDAVAATTELANLTSGVRLISEVEALLRSEQFDAASVRLNDLRELIVHTRRARPHDQDTDRTFQRSIALVASFQHELLKRHYSPAARYDPLSVHRRLREISDFLNGLAAVAGIEGGG